MGWADAEKSSERGMADEADHWTSGHLQQQMGNVRFIISQLLGERSLTLAYSTYALPPAYSGASHTPIAISPSKVNSTHWTATARCLGCTQWSGGNIDTKTTTRFAYACSKTAVASPTSNTTTFSIHSDVGGFDHDLTIARNAS